MKPLRASWVGLGLVVVGAMWLGCGKKPSGPPEASTKGPAATTASMGSGQPREPALPPAISDAEKTIRAVRPHLRGCFFDLIRRRPTATSTITLRFEVGRDGSVTDVVKEASSGLDDTCIACMTQGAKTAKFSPPKDGMPATVVAPFTFHSASGTEVPPLPPTAPPSFIVPQPAPTR